MITIVTESSEVVVPAWVSDLESFRRWADAEDFPEEGRICYLNGGVWVDMSREQVFFHGTVKTKIIVTLGGLVEADRLGRFWADGVALSNEEANISTVPDAIFVSTETLRSG